MDLVVRKNKEKALAKIWDKRIEGRKSLLQMHEVQLKLNNMEMMVAEAGVSKPIRNINDEELVEEIAVVVKFICRDVGIRDYDKYDAARFYKSLKLYYNHLTIKEVKIAFELLLMGELDEWLPRDKNGRPDRNHYNSFNLDYFTKVVRAYMERKSEVWRKARLCLPVPEMILTEKEKEENNKVFLQDIYDAFDSYKKNGRKPRFIFSMFINEMIEQGLIEKKPKPSKAVVERALNDIINGNMSRIEKNLAMSSFERNKPNGVLLNDAQILANNDEIEKAFFKLVRDKNDIRDFIK